MNDEKWQNLIEQAKKNFDDVSIYSEDLLVETSEGLIKQGSLDILEFTNDQGTFKITRESKPVVLGKTMHFSHRQGDSARTEYQLSETEKTHKVSIYRQNNLGEWVKIDADPSAIWR